MDGAGPCGHETALLHPKPCFAQPQLFGGLQPSAPLGGPGATTTITCLALLPAHLARRSLLPRVRACKSVLCELCDPKMMTSCDHAMETILQPLVFFGRSPAVVLANYPPPPLVVGVPPHKPADGTRSTAHRQAPQGCGSVGMHHLTATHHHHSRLISACSQHRTPAVVGCPPMVVLPCRAGHAPRTTHQLTAG